MTPEERAAMIAHDARVKALADRMPDKALWCAVCAIGYRADKDTGITSAFSVATMAQESRKPRNLNGAYAISESTLRRAIKALTEAGVIKIRATVRGPDDGWKQANDYVIDYDYTDRERIMEAWEMGKRERRRERERRGNASRLANLPPADDEAARIAAELQDYGDPLDCDDPWCVCEGDQETHRWWQALPGVEKARRTEEGRFRPDA